MAAICVYQFWFSFYLIDYDEYILFPFYLTNIFQIMSTIYALSHVFRGFKPMT